MTQQLLIKYKCDYADEFDVHGFMVATTDWWAKHLEEAATILEEKGEVERYFGTNESVIYESFNEYQRCFTVTELSEDQYSVLTWLFGESWRNSKRVDFGHVLLIER